MESGLKPCRRLLLVAKINGLIPGRASFSALTEQGERGPICVQSFISYSQDCMRLNRREANSTCPNVPTFIRF